MEDEKDGVWKTISGRRVFIRNGESLSDAMRNSGKFNKPKKSYQDWDSDEKKRFRRWYRKHAGELFRNYEGSEEEIKEKAKEQWAKEHNLDGPKEPVNKAKEISDRIREQRDGKSPQDNVQHDYSKGQWDPETKSYVLEDGHRIEMLKKKEYKELCQKQLENSSEATKEIVDSYTISQATAGSCDLNKITPKNIADKYRFSAIGVMEEPGLTMSKREKDMLDNKMYKDWMENYETKKTNDIFDNRELEDQWRKKWNIKDDTSPWQLKPSWSSDIDPKTGEKIIWTKSEIEEAKAVAKELYRLEDIKWKAEYGSEKYLAAEKEWDEIISTIENERLRVKGRSAYWYDEIGKYDDEVVYGRNVDWEGLKETGKLTYLNAQEQIDLEWTDDLRSIQSTETLRRIDGLKRSVQKFDDAFKNDGTVLDHDIMVYRRSYESTEEMEEGYIKLGYTSTSAQDTLPKKMPSGIHFGEQEQYIIIPKGSKVLFAEDIIGYKHSDVENYEERYAKSDNGLRRQHEIILPRGTSFKQVGKVVENGWNVVAHVLKAEVKEEYKDGKRD